MANRQRHALVPRCNITALQANPAHLHALQSVLAPRVALRQPLVLLGQRGVADLNRQPVLQVQQAHLQQTGQERGRQGGQGKRCQQRPPVAPPPRHPQQRCGLLPLPQLCFRPAALSLCPHAPGTRSWPWPPPGRRLSSCSGRRCRASSGRRYRAGWRCGTARHTQSAGAQGRRRAEGASGNCQGNFTVQGRLQGTEEQSGSATWRPAAERPLLGWRLPGKESHSPSASSQRGWAPGRCCTRWGSRCAPSRRPPAGGSSRGEVSAGCRHGRSAKGSGQAPRAGVGRVMAPRWPAGAGQRRGNSPGPGC